MKWLGPMLHMMFPPKCDARTVELQQLLEGKRETVAELAVSRARLEQHASRGAVIDDLAGERG